MDYDPKNFPRMAGIFCESGATDARLAQMFDTSAEVIRNWKEEYPAFSEACAKGRNLARAAITNTLMKVATGSKGKRTKIVNVDGVPMQISVQEERPPNPYAAAVLLSQGHEDSVRPDYESMRTKVLDDLAKRFEGTALRPREE